ncbi:MAG: hypothetical protein ACRCWM_02385 [Sarcina sp.]
MNYNLKRLKLQRRLTQLELKDKSHKISELESVELAYLKAEIKKYKELLKGDR